MPQQYVIDNTIAAEDRVELDRLAADKLVTVDAVWSWFSKHGYKFSRTAVWEWRVRHLALLADPAEQLRRYIRGRLDGMNLAQIDIVCRQVSAIE